ncbi:uncharacterized protein TRIADDRAFT_58916 [Trichoplax adhaerens]|uniref:Uncharacterized protein n=1 Tax=Trichoplax adhaerens TaxID=10228 RepID=B3S412_TRIAD|nr:predicted protein [Trichoplax adhaerens]EDV22561.1 predicted protein [Trichoplax adhaerens]|eukprot:XP_002115105.1 predicted protein [Trichoplax adhaerens]
MTLLLFSFSFSLMTIISTAMAMSTSMASSTAFYEMPLAQSLTFNQKVAISYMAIIDVIIISSNIYSSYQYWMELQNSVGQEEVTNTCLITRKISRQCLIAGCIGLIHYYLNLIFGRQLSNTYLGTNMLVLGNIGIICQRSCNLSFTAIVSFIFGCQQARNSSEKLIINYLIATSVGLFISVTIIMIKSNILQTPPIEIEAIRKRRG